MRIQRKTASLLILLLLLITFLAPAVPSAALSRAGTAVPEATWTAPVSAESTVIGSAYGPSVAEDVYGSRTMLWQVGIADNRSTEFTVYNDVYSELSLPLGPGTLEQLPRGMKADVNGTMSLSFALPAVPVYGVQLSLKVLDASTAIPQLAVFTNGQLSGLLQISGLNNGETVPVNTWRETYELYIPKEQLQAGSNVLELSLDPGLYADPQAAGYTGDQYLWFEWDYLKLEALSRAAEEPIHGRYVHLGTTLAASTFRYDEHAIRHLGPMAKWLGIAYSGNWMRASFWSDTSTGWDPQGRNYLATLRDLNLAPMVNIIGANWKGNTELAAGTTPAALRTYYANFVAKYGDLYEYAETGNEPGLFGWSQQAVLAIHELMDEQRQLNSQPYLKIVAPGWAYWPYNGIPDGWERDAEARRPIEELSDITNGHSYGGTGVQPLPGAALYENLRVYAGAEEGFGKEMAMSETGANDNHTDNTKYGTYAYRFASAFDRELRADIGYADHIMQHAAFFNDGTEFGLFRSDINWNTHRFEETEAVPARGGEAGETRLKTFRRLAAAYATHGSPLSYELLNASALTGKKAYFRAVDTSALEPSAVGAAADKILLNFVNFEREPLTMQVRVTMPDSGVYAGDRYGAGSTYAAAYSGVQLTAAPDLTLTVTLGAGETVQYILEQPEQVAPTAPAGLTAQALSHEQIRLAWTAAADNDAVVSYSVYRNGGTAPVVTVPGRITFWSDYTVAPSTAYSYTVQAVDDSGNVSLLSPAASATTPAITVTPHVYGDPGKFEAEAATFALPLKIGNNSGASGGKVVEQTHAGPIAIEGFHSATGGSYTLSIAYASSQESKKNIYVNGVKQSTVTLPSTGSWTANITARQYGITLQPGYNTISFTSGGNGANLDYFRLDEGAYVPVASWYPVEHNNAYIDYTGFETAPSGVSHVTYAPEASAVFHFTGTGIRWRSDIKSDMGSAEVYVDGAYRQTIVIPQAGLEGDDKVVYELTGLEYGLHRIDIRNTSGRVVVHGFEFEGYEATLPVPGPDMIVTDIGWNIVNADGSPSAHTTPQLGDSLIFWAKVKNVGVRPTPLNSSTGAGMITGGVFSVDGGTVSWTDTHTGVIQPGEEVILTANSSAQGTPRWTIPTIGDYQITFFVNDIWRYGEMNKENNKLTVTLNVPLP
ncbi:carbohydrate-binding domain-containing protein [Paenibacillus tengchongensis]|uniref:carbohydrate-binding domain-containing protein n=1 Tax=Paenibacillus tengchongensis TaxID=2608684 RepID=UPI00124E649F|nr:carbohydrate-binding domain-containing protein [Paenibacillus tengchongensis]